MLARRSATPRSSLKGSISGPGKVLVEDCSEPQEPEGFWGRRHCREFPSVFSLCLGADVLWAGDAETQSLQFTSAARDAEVESQGLVLRTEQGRSC